MDYKFNISVNLLHATPLEILVNAIRQCYESFDKSDSDYLTVMNYGEPEQVWKLGTKDKALVERIIECGHSSTLEHITFNFQIKGISRLNLQELARHRMASLSCLSGDNLLYYDLPSTVESNIKCRHKMSIADFFDKWVNGSKPSGMYNVRIPMRDRLSKMNFRFYNTKTKEIEHTKITDIVHKGKKEVFEIIFENGYTLKATSDHRILSKEGWKTLEDINLKKLSTNYCSFTPNNEFACNGIPLYQNKEWLEQQIITRSISDISEECFVSDSCISKWLKKHSLKYSVEYKKNISIQNLNSGRLEIPWNKGKTYTTDKSKRKVRNKSTYRRGSDCNLYKNGYSQNNIRQSLEPYYNYIREKFEYKCVLCSSNKGHHIHHINPVWNAPELANDKDNLTLLCVDCHKKIHTNHNDLLFLECYTKGDFTLIKENLNIKQICPDAKKPKRTTKLTVSWQKIKEIRFIGVEDVYDLEVEHSESNFVCNGVVVHNCKSSRYTLKELKDEKSFIKDNTDYDRASKYINFIGIDQIDQASLVSLENLRQLVQAGYKNDECKYALPESYKLDLYYSINARSLQNLLNLRMSEKAHFEIRELAYKIYDAIPEDYKFLFKVN